MNELTRKAYIEEESYKEDGIVFLNNIRHIEYKVQNYYGIDEKRTRSEIMFISDIGNVIKWVNTDIIKLI